MGQATPRPDDTETITEITRLITEYARGFAGDPAFSFEFYARPMILVGAEALAVLATARRR